jgi:hypothetical protein
MYFCNLGYHIKLNQENNECQKILDSDFKTAGRGLDESNVK